VHDPYDLERFVAAQNPVFEQVRAELRAGRKRTHWMWFVFPQMKGLGRSAMAEKYAIASPEVAQRILQRLQQISKPYGTTMTIEGNVGVIRVAASPATKH